MAWSILVAVAIGFETFFDEFPVGARVANAVLPRIRFDALVKFASAFGIYVNLHSSSCVSSKVKTYVFGIQDWLDSVVDSLAERFLPALFVPRFRQVSEHLSLTERAGFPRCIKMSTDSY